MSIDRRQFLKYAGAGSALAALPTGFVYEYCGHIESGLSQTFLSRINIPGLPPTR
ncbi:twin-arginine translocation signal domain-containing protein [Iodobacter arcticus]|uniref:Twin-arginine translocation signal domain-containing protein n=1 Tax=Iodobacter arcticus TaxID=590593 RepID=A0ABW2QVY9_9NEIS